MNARATNSSDYDGAADEPAPRHGRLLGRHGATAPAQLSLVASHRYASPRDVSGMDFLTASLYGQLFSSATISHAADGAVIVHSAPGRYVAWLAAFLVLLPVARWCWRRGIGGPFAPGVFFASFTIPLIVLPGIAIESVRVSPDSIVTHGGLWHSPTHRHFPLSDLESIVETKEPIAQRGFQRRDTFWEFRYRSSPSRRLKLSDLLDANRTHIIEYLRQHGFVIRAA